MSRIILTSQEVDAIEPMETQYAVLAFMLNPVCRIELMKNNRWGITYQDGMKGMSNVGDWYSLSVNMRPYMNARLLLDLFPKEVKILMERDYATNQRIEYRVSTEVDGKKAGRSGCNVILERAIIDALLGYLRFVHFHESKGKLSPLPFYEWIQVRHEK